MQLIKQYFAAMAGGAFVVISQLASRTDYKPNHHWALVCFFIVVPLAVAGHASAEDFVGPNARPTWMIAALFSLTVGVLVLGMCCLAMSFQNWEFIAFGIAFIVGLSFASRAIK
jgi:hypothetical protein